MPVRIIVKTLIPSPSDSETQDSELWVLSPEERQRALRFHHARDRWSYAAAHQLLRTMLTEFHGGSPLEWTFRLSPFGKPEIEWDRAHAVAPRFNISHTHGLVACGLTLDYPGGLELGVDVESLFRSINAADLAQRFFSENESRWLDTLPESDVQSAFIRLWTIKEAIAKATGRGLQLDFRSFSCSLNPLSVTFHDPLSKPEWVWDLATGFIPPGHWVSLAVHRPPGLHIAPIFRQQRGLMKDPGI